MASSRKSHSPDILAAGWDACVAGYVQPRQSLLVGLSGGVDSVTMLHWLCHRIVGTDISLRAMHVHHGLSQNADDWADVCTTLCCALNVPLTIARVAVQRRSWDGLEGAARRARYDALLASDADWVLLAHHRGDQAETLLFNLLRGSGVQGVGAMRSRRGRLLRPWLAVGREDILRYARKHGLRWIEDESNSDLRFARNFLRKRALPLIGERFPGAEKSLAAAADRFVEAQQLLDDLARIDLADQPETFPLPVALLTRLNRNRAANLLAYALRRAELPVPGADRLFELLRQLADARADRHPVVRFGEYHLARRGGMVVLEPIEVKDAVPCDVMTTEEVPT